MNPFVFAARVAGVTLLTAGGLTLFMMRRAPRKSELITGAAHFRRGFDEFQKGFRTILFGSGDPSPEEVRKERESSRVAID